MTKCKQCGKEKPEKEFPWLLQRVCHDCHMWNAMHWSEIPWPKSTLTEVQRKARKKGTDAMNAKGLNHAAKEPTISTETEKTTQTTEAELSHEINHA